MSIKTALQKKFQNLFIAVMFNEAECVLQCKVLKDGLLQKTFTKQFPLTLPLEALDKALENYLLSLQDEYPFVYIAYLLDAMGQGAIEGIGNNSFSKYSIDIHTTYHVSLHNQWSAYTSYNDLKGAKNLFSEVGIDFIYSPFILLNDFIVTQKLKSKATCFLLNCQNFFIVVVVKEKQLFFGALFKIQNDTSFSQSESVNDWENEQKEDEIISENEMPELAQNTDDDLDEMNDLGELTDLDDMDEMRSADSFSDVDDKVMGHFEGLDNISEEDISLELYGRDLMVYKYLKSSLEEYYHNPLYTSEFIDEIIIFDGYEISSELIHQLEDELMMDVEIHKVDVCDRMCDIAIAEVFK